LNRRWRGCVSRETVKLSKRIASTPELDPSLIRPTIPPVRTRRFFLLAILILGFGGAALVYTARKHGFTSRWRELITSEFADRGIYCDIGRLTIDPFSGLVARNVRLFEDIDHRTLLANVNNITLDIDLARLVRAQQFLNTVDLRDADISIPVDPEEPEGERLEVRNFSARFQMPEHKFDISGAEFELNGVLCSVTASLLQPVPVDEAPEEKAARLRRRGELLSTLRGRDGIVWTIVSELEKLHFSQKTKPRLDLTFIGDLDDPENIKARLQFRAIDAGRGTYYCDSIEASVRYDYPYILLDQLDIRDSYGKLHAHATHLVGGKSIDFGLESSIDSHTLIRSFLEIEPLGDVLFYSSPKLHLDGTYFLGSDDGPPPLPGELPLHVIGGIDCGQFMSQGAMFEGLHVDFCIDREKKFFRNFVLDHSSGNLSGQVLVDGDALRYKGSLDMDPTTFIPFFQKEKTKTFLRRFRFGRNPSVSVQFEGGGPLSNPPAWKTDGYAKMMNFHYNDVPAELAVGHFSIRDRNQTFTDFHLDRREGRLAGDRISIDYATKVTEISNLHGRVFPATTIAYVAPKITPVLAPYRFPAPPQLTVNGTVDPIGRKATDLMIEFSADEAQYEVLGKTLTLGKPTGRVRILNGRVEPELTASVLGGEGTFSGVFGIAPENRGFHARVDVERTRFREIATAYKLDSETEGTVSGYFNFKGSGLEGDPVQGDGEATINDGNVFSIPVLGPLSKFMGVLMPRSKPGYSTAHEATAHFVMADNVIHTRDFAALTPAFKLSGSGSVNTKTKAINFDAEMNFRGTVASIVFFPVSKLLKYKGEGTLDDPRWRPINFTLPRREGEPEPEAVAGTASDGPASPAREEEPKERRFLPKLPLPKLPFPKIPLPKLRDLIPGGD
jgi:hypothetical protein